MAACGQTENGANHCMFGSANMATRSGRTNMRWLSFSAPFLCFFLWTNKERKEKKEILGEQKMNNKKLGFDKQKNRPISETVLNISSP